jgi:formylmethanofuran dehydrogenase subunit D
VKRAGRHGICIDPEAAELLGVKEGDKVLAAKR